MLTDATLKREMIGVENFFYFFAVVRCIMKTGFIKNTVKEVNESLEKTISIQRDELKRVWLRKEKESEIGKLYNNPAGGNCDKKICETI